MMSRTSPQIGIIVLAAGASTRMGQHKLLCALGTTAVIRISTQTALESGIGPVALVTGNAAASIAACVEDLPCRLIHNEHWYEGQATSVACAVKALEDYDALIVMAGDQPFITAQALRRLLEAWKTSNSAIVLSKQGAARGNPALFDSRVFGALLQLTGDQGARQLFDDFVPQEVEQQEPQLFCDIDDPAALAQARLFWAQTHSDPRDDFPLMGAATARAADGRAYGLIYLDSAATTQVPASVLAAQRRFEQGSRANIHRGIYPLAEAASEAYEEARLTVARFFGSLPHATIFTHGATEALNLIAFGWGRAMLKEGDLVLIDTAAHHSAIVCWQMLAQQIGIRLAFIPVIGELPSPEALPSFTQGSSGRIDQEAFGALLEHGPKAVVLSHVSNVTGFANDIPALAQAAHQAGALVVADCAQSAGHMPLDFARLGADFAALSAHKMYGPFGIGALLADERALAQLKPFMGGGGMIKRVGASGYTLDSAPACFEAGTPNVTGAIGFAAACRYLDSYGLSNLMQQSRVLSNLASSELSAIDGLQLIGQAGPGRTSIIAFLLDGVHPHDVAQGLADRGIAVRAGHHCAQPLHEALGIFASVRASFAAYNTSDEVTLLADALRSVQEEYRCGT